MINLYRVMVFILWLFIPLIKIFSSKAKNFLIKRDFEKDKIEKTGKDFQGKYVVWLHAASVGELEQCKAIGSVIKNMEPGIRIIQSVFSDSVTEKQLLNSGAHFVFHLPLDTVFAYEHIFHAFCPQALIIAAWDTWPNLLKAANRHKCSAFLACGTLSKSSGRNSFFVRNITSETLQLFSGISPAHEIFHEDFNKLTKGKVKIKVCGDSRFDSVVSKIEKNKIPDELLDFFLHYQKEFKPGSLDLWRNTISKNNYKICILASTYKECEDLIFPRIKEILALGFHVWIFPHKVDEDRIESVKENLEKFEISFNLYTRNRTMGEHFNKVTLFDKIGILAHSYSVGDIAYVGGAIHNRVHNVIEPAYFGLPIITGEKIQNSPEAMVLEKEEGLTKITNDLEFIQTLKLYLHNIDTINKKNREFVKKNTGASQKFYDEFLKDAI